MNKIAISMGDPAGIGPEVAVNAALNPRVKKVARPVLFGAARHRAAV
jgi:4-hydroxy-L-threonine phosphate dehydrogenase PdxA